MRGLAGFALFATFACAHGEASAARAWVTTADRRLLQQPHAVHAAAGLVCAHAQRVASSGDDAALAHVAFVNPDGSRALILVNALQSERTVRVTDAAHRWRISLPARAVATVTWHR